MADSNRIATAHEMIARYNAQDADAYVALMTDDACEAGYRGAVLRETVSWSSTVSPSS